MSIYKEFRTPTRFSAKQSSFVTRFLKFIVVGPVEVQYIADENGYQPSGPGVHPDIQKAVAEQVALARQEGPYPPGPAGPARLVQARY